MTTETPKKTPLLDLLRSVPADGRHVYEHDPTHHQNIPYGRLCREAADEIAELRAQVAQYKEDAERYRWLRDTNLDAGVRATGEHLEPLQVPMIFIGHPEDQWTLGSFASAWVGEKFDRAIDAAIDKARKTT